MSKIIRVFARKTSYSPEDDMAFFGPPPFSIEAEEIHISCLFIWDKPKAEWLAKQWSGRGKVKIGGPAYDAVGGEFVPGKYTKLGEVITSRGCPNKCPYCFVPKREGRLRLLPITEGWDVLDNNLLACPKSHIESVIGMLGQQKQKAMFRGGLEAKLIDDWFVGQLSKLRLQCLFVALDRPADKDPVYNAVKKLQKAGYNHRQICCYVLVGWRDDTPEAALRRLCWVRDIGAMPFAMYFRNEDDLGKTPPPEWQRKVVRPFCRPAAIFAPQDYKRETDQGNLFDPRPAP